MCFSRLARAERRYLSRIARGHACKKNLRTVSRRVVDSAAAAWALSPLMVARRGHTIFEHGCEDSPTTGRTEDLHARSSIAVVDPVGSGHEGQGRAEGIQPRLEGSALRSRREHARA